MKKTLIISLVVGIVLSLGSILYSSPRDYTVFSQCEENSQRSVSEAEAYTFKAGWPIRYIETSYCNNRGEQTQISIEYLMFATNTLIFSGLSYLVLSAHTYDRIKKP